MGKTVAIIGAGPIGLAAAHGVLRRGHTPIVFERDEPGASLAAIGGTRFFSPLGMNVPKDLLAIAASAGVSLDPSAVLSGAEHATILRAIAGSGAFASHVFCNHRVTRVTRHTMSRGEQAGHPVRAELPFRIVVESQEGERTLEADAVLDASGLGLAVPLPSLGASTLDANGLENGAIRDLRSLYAKRTHLSGKRVLLVGHGHSAANAILFLESLAHDSKETRVVWAVRSRNRRPLEATPSDPLPERANVVTKANALAEKPPAWLTVERNAFVERYARGGGGGPEEIRVELAGKREARVDFVVALIGARPDLAPLSELPLEISARTEGAAGLARALANVTDCLSVPAVSPNDLASGEPRFHLIGAKSYGRARTFLLQTGYAQLESVLDGLFVA